MYTIDEITHLTGIPGNKAVDICNLLTSEGYLDYDSNSGKYRLTRDPDFLENIKRVREQLHDENKFDQVCSKIEDIVMFGKPLALSDKERNKAIRDIGIPGLNIIFNGLEEEQDDFQKNGRDRRVPGLPQSHCLLVKGAPGTGKTTMGMQIALHMAKYRSLFLTFEEEVDQLVKNMGCYFYKKVNNTKYNLGAGWRSEDVVKVTRSLKKFLTPSAWDDIELVIQAFCSILDRQLPQLVVIDSISRFKEIAGEDKARRVLRRLIRILKIREITSIFLGEDRGETSSFEEFEVDGIIRLGWEGDQLSLFLEKMRGFKCYKGPHSVALFSADAITEKAEHRFIAYDREEKKKRQLHLKAGLNVFPDIAVFKDSYYSKDMESIIDGSDQNTPMPIKTGTEGLDKLLLMGNDGGFKNGETVILIGSAGSGKTLLALNFMLKGYLEDKKSEKPKSGKKKIAVWINLEGDIGTLKFAIHGFESKSGSWGDNLRKMVDSAEREHATFKRTFCESDRKDDHRKNDDNRDPVVEEGAHDQSDESSLDTEGEAYFKFLSYPPINLDLNMIIYTLAALHEKYDVDRLVIDSITELERSKGGAQPEVKVFLAGLIQFLRERNITTMFICRSDTFFRSIDKIEEQILSLVDLIICIRNFDIRNQIQKGIYIQKARGRSHNSKIMRLTIDSRDGIGIEDSGWDVEHLLAGDTSNIQAPKVFFKLFYENPAETKINESIIEDFDTKRYPGDEPIFREVKKSSIHTEFWSFRGQYSAGHANTRVLSIADHVISAFRDNKRLTELKLFVKAELIKNIEKNPYLLRLFDYEKKEDSENDSKYIIDAIPSYRDFGVMVYREMNVKKKNAKAISDYLKILNRFAGISKKMEAGQYHGDNEWLDVDLRNGNTGKAGYTWENLKEWIKGYNKERKNIDGNENNSSLFKNAFAFPPLDKKSEFIAFFMEVLWSFGGDIYDISIYKDYKIHKYRHESKDIIKKRILFDLHKCSTLFAKKKVSDGEEGNEKGRLEDSIETDGNNNVHEDIGFNDFLIALENDENEYYKELKERFEEKYGIAQERVKFDDFIKWILETFAKNEYRNPCPDPILKWDSKPFKDTLNLIIELIYEGGVINPIHGDYRREAVLSRYWYSHLCLEEEQNAPHEYNRELLPLPLGKSDMNGRPLYRSVSCNTYWCLVMLKDALSPEIGGNFIESLVATDYYKERLKNKAGLPIVNWELAKKEYSDIDSSAYTLMKRIADNGAKHEKLNESLSAYMKDRDTNDLKTILHNNDNAFIRFDMIKKVANEVQMAQYNPEENVLNKRLFFPMYRQMSIGFYHIEQALHYQIRKLLMLEPEGTGKPASAEDFKIRIKSYIDKELYKNNPDSLDDENWWEKVQGKVINEFRLHVTLELLVSFYLEDVEAKFLK
jgi:KaiC/GvpD/RAD55 family RecA-like ATPase